MNSRATRRLIWVPVIHTQADLGNMSESVKNLYIRRMGGEKWARHIKTIHEMWQRIRREVEGLDLDYRTVRLYQDGLPDCGHEAQIVASLAKAGSHNHRLLLKLTKRGARITGTESPQLLLEEYELARRLLIGAGSHQRPRPAPHRVQQDRHMLDMRDRYIAERINKTLKPGETGVIFLGMLHSLTGRLASDIEVTRMAAHLGSPRMGEAPAHYPKRQT